MPPLLICRPLLRFLRRGDRLAWQDLAVAGGFGFVQTCVLVVNCHRSAEPAPALVVALKGLTGLIDQHGRFGRATTQESYGYEKRSSFHFFRPLEFFAQISVSIDV